jgi:flagellar hook-basal body complex protein FliE
MAVSPIGGVGGLSAMNLSQLAATQRQQVVAGSTEAVAGTAASGTAVGRAEATRGSSFAQAIGDGLREVESLDRNAGGKAVQAATGDLNDVHDYVIAATQAQVATELTTTVRNKALEAFNEIMRMPL